MAARLALALVALFWAAGASADVPARRQLVTGELMGHSGCHVFTLCSAQTATGACVDATPDEIVADLSGFATATAYATSGTSTDFTCNLFSNLTGHDAGSATAGQVNGSSLTEASRIQVLPFGLARVWGNCPEIANGNVTIEVIACR